MRVWARTWTSNVRDEIEDLDTDLMRVYKLLKRLGPTFRFLIGFLLVATALAGCATPDPPDLPDAEAQISQMRLELGGKDERRLITFYVGGMVTGAGADPFEAGWVSERGGAFYLDVAQFPERYSILRGAFETAADDGVVDWNEFESIVEVHYYDYRSLPTTITALKEVAGDWSKNPDWFTFDVNGVMSPSRRRIYVKRSLVLDALKSYETNDSQMLYAIGTTFISEHLSDAISESGGNRDGTVEGAILEVSVMTKRADGEWDFYAYDSIGEQTNLLRREPSDLNVPTKCVGCHFGSRLFEPERSFPADARAAPDGPRRLYVRASMKRPDVVLALDEHRKRSDSVLGLYGTLLVGALISDPDPRSDIRDLLSELGL